MAKTDWARTWSGWAVVLKGKWAFVAHADNPNGPIADLGFYRRHADARAFVKLLREQGMYPRIERATVTLAPEKKKR